MIRQFLYSLLLAVSLSSQLCALIIESDSIQSIEQYVQEDTLVIFDIDNTIAMPKGTIGSDQWFGHLIRQAIKEGFEGQHAVDHILPTYCEVQNAIDLRPVENCTVSYIKSLQERNIPAIALTARSMPLVFRTVKQLKNIGIDFTHNSLYQRAISERLDHHWMYKNGIIFCGRNGKDAVLTAFFDLIDHWPKRIIFVDDKLKYIEQITQSFESHGIECVGIRYSHLDEWVKSFDPKLAQKELHELYNQVIV